MSSDIGFWRDVCYPRVTKDMVLDNGVWSCQGERHVIEKGWGPDEFDKNEGRFVVSLNICCVKSYVDLVNQMINREHKNRTL